MLFWLVEIQTWKPSLFLFQDVPHILITIEYMQLVFSFLSFNEL